jgi:alpha-D-ribose 1-methylphosphonate 5-triphosphate synthase subunit PhnH
LAAGFADPVGAAQTTFRAVLTALSEPGTIVPLEVELEAPPPLGLAAAAIGLSLLDGDTPLWCDPTCRAAAPSLRFHTGAPLIDAPEQARFALIGDIAQLPSLATFDAGTDEYPDRSATLIIEVATIGSGTAGDKGTLMLRGPGIPDRRRLAIGGLPAGFAAEWRANHARFPRGVDLILTAGRRLVGLPRSTVIEEA